MKGGREGKESVTSCENEFARLYVLLIPSISSQRFFASNPLHLLISFFLFSLLLNSNLSEASCFKILIISRKTVLNLQLLF